MTSLRASALLGLLPLVGSFPFGCTGGHAPGDPPMDPADTEQKEQALDCISRNVFWYEVSDAQGRLGYISRKYLSD